MDARRGVIWDVDGTLVDTAHLHRAAFERFCREEGRGFSHDDFVWTFGRRNPDIMVHLFGPERAARAGLEMAERKERYYREAARATGIPLLPGARPLIDAFTRAGWPQAIGSSAPPANLELIFELTGLAPLLAAVVSGDDTARGKPDPEVFLTAAAKLGLAPSQCVVFEDAVAGVQAARAAGTRVVGVTACGHSPPAALAAAGAHRVVGTLAELTLADVERLFTG